MNGRSAHFGLLGAFPAIGMAKDELRVFLHGAPQGRAIGVNSQGNLQRPERPICLLVEGRRIPFILSKEMPSGGTLLRSVAPERRHQSLSWWSDEAVRSIINRGCGCRRGRGRRCRCGGPTYVEHHWTSSSVMVTAVVVVVGSPHRVCR